MFLDLPRRLAKTLLHLAKKAKPTPNGPKVTLTQSDVGKIIGMSRKSTNKHYGRGRIKNGCGSSAAGL
jgi:hypothetical protein